MLGWKVLAIDSIGREYQKFKDDRPTFLLFHQIRVRILVFTFVGPHAIYQEPLAIQNT
jgi:hypothetical protein